MSKVSVNGHRPAQLRHDRAGKLQRHAVVGTCPPARRCRSVVRYAGTPRPIRSLWGEVGFEELTNGALVAGQPNGAASWFPCDDHPSSKASYRIQISTENPYHALANGELESRRTRAAMTTWTYEQRRADVDLSDHPADRRVRGAPAHQDAGADACRTAATPSPELRPRLRPTAADDEALRQAVRPLPARDRVHRGGDRRRPRDSA